MSKELLVEHCEFPRHQGKPDIFDIEHLCQQEDTGDVVELWLCVAEGNVIQINWRAKGSRLLCASCSIMSEYLIDRTIEDAISTAEAFIVALTGEAEPDDIDCYGASAALFGVRHLPARVRCVTLPWRGFIATCVEQR